MKWTEMKVSRTKDLHLRRGQQLRNTYTHLKIQWNSTWRAVFAAPLSIMVYPRTWPKRLKTAISFNDPLLRAWWQWQKYNIWHIPWIENWKALLVMSTNRSKGPMRSSYFEFHLHTWTYRISARLCYIWIRGKERIYFTRCDAHSRR